MKGNVLARREIQELLDKYVIAELYTDRLDSAHAEIDRANSELLRTRFGTSALPIYVIVNLRNEEVARIEGIASASTFREFLEKGLREAK